MHNSQNTQMQVLQADRMSLLIVSELNTEVRSLCFSYRGESTSRILLSVFTSLFKVECNELTTHDKMSCLTRLFLDRLRLEFRRMKVTLIAGS